MNLLAERKLQPDWQLDWRITLAATLLAALAGWFITTEPERLKVGIDPANPTHWLTLALLARIMQEP